MTTTIDHSPQGCLHCQKLVRDYHQWYDEHCPGSPSTMHEIKDFALLPADPEPETETETEKE